MDDDVDYESLGGKYPMSVNAAAGAIAGYFEHVAVYPIDVVKTRMQTIRTGCAPTTSNPIREIQNIYRFEGGRALLRGSGAVLMGCGPAHAFQFCIYEKTKSYLDNKKVPYLSNYNANIGGALGAFFHDLWMNPCEVLKQRLQMKNSPYINQSYGRIANSIYRQEGLRAFYLSFGTQLSMNVPFAFIHFGLYDQVKKQLNPDNRWDPISNAVCGAVSGGTAAFVTTPLDVIKTVLNTQENFTTQQGCTPCEKSCKVKGTLHIGTIRAAIHHINSTRLTRNPLTPYFRGCWARVLQAAPGCALSWIAYEFMKTVLEAETAQKKVDTGNLNEVNVAKSIGEKRNESVKL